MKRHILVVCSAVMGGVLMIPLSHAQTNTQPQRISKRPVIYVMPNAVTDPGSTDSGPIIGTSHDGKEPQVAKTYQELQHRKECEAFSENMKREKADYFLLMQHGGGIGNRWAVSDKNGDVIASGQSVTVGGSVKDACLAMAKDWQRISTTSSNSQ